MSGKNTFNARNININKAPRKIEILGDKTKRPEPAQHIIEFPGGAIELSRTSDDHYWAHIIINRHWANKDQAGMWSSLGQVIGSRIDTGEEVIEIPEHEGILEIAVLIKSCGLKLPED